MAQDKYFNFSNYNNAFWNYNNDYIYNYKYKYFCVTMCDMYSARGSVCVRFDQFNIRKFDGALVTRVRLHNWIEDYETDVVV